MEKKYDLTKKDVLWAVLGDWNSIIKVGKSLIDSFFNNTESISKQQEAAEALIKRGKEEGVDEIEITLENTNGFKFNAPIEGVNIDACLGSNDKMTLKVKYKQH